jgi:hypothetical protein
MTVRHSSTRIGWFFLALFFCLVTAVSAIGLSYHAKHKKFSTLFAKMQVGDTKETVVQELGHPDEIERCNNVSSKQDLNKGCFETYWFTSFLERWGVSFDKDGKIVDKTYNVSY